MPEHRPGWDDYFLGLAFLVSRRSHDVHTKHGCLLVDRHSHVVGTGYNGFPAGMDDASLPTCRPDKYAWMWHSEENAVANATVPLRDAGVTMYCTGRPCLRCANALVRHGVTHWVHADRRGMTTEAPADVARFDRLVAERGVDVRVVRPDLAWLFDAGLVAELAEHRFIAIPEAFPPTMFAGT